MAEILPFRAWRYNTDVVPDIRKSLSPLFDVVNAEQLAELYREPNNSIHVSVPQSLEAATGKWRDWQRSGVVRQDPLPGIYAYYQQFHLWGQPKIYTRKGFVAMARLRPEDIILHEEVMAHAVNDRIALLEATQVNIAPTHGLYRDQNFELEAIMDAYIDDPLYEYTDYQGVINRLTPIQHPGAIAAFRRIMAQQPIYLADGHHRLESSYRYQAKHRTTPVFSWADYHMMYLTNLCSDDLRILPTHRVAQGIETYDLLEKMAHLFDIEEVTHLPLPLYDALDANLSRFTCGVIIGYKKYVITLKNEIDPLQTIPHEMPDVLKTLDYTVLHTLIFDHILGITYAQQANHPAIRYEKDYDRAAHAAHSHPETVSFIMRGVSMEKMLEICDSGVKMPPKSTYFYPKVICGLIFGSVAD